MDIVCDKLGFKSENAKNFVTNCGDHHDSWQIFQITIEVLAREIIHCYIDAHVYRKNVSVLVMYNWKEQMKNSSFYFYFELVFNVMLGLKCFHSGAWRNNSNFLLAGRQKAGKMFFNKHNIYRSIITNDMKCRVVAPPVAADCIAKNELFSQSGCSLRGDGGDYITENENKYLKQNLPPGVPSFEKWKIASWNHKTLQKNCLSDFYKAEIIDPGNNQSSMFNFAMEIHSVWKLIHKSKPLANPDKEIPLKSLDGQNLHPSLVNFFFTASENYTSYLSNKGSELQPAFVTHADEIQYNNINNWTVNQIDKEIKKLTSKIKSEYKRVSERTLYVKLKQTGKSKSSHVSFLQELCNNIKIHEDICLDHGDITEECLEGISLDHSYIAT